MSFKLTYVQRRDPDTPSLERVFSAIGETLKRNGAEVSFEKLPFGNNALGMLKSALFYKPGEADIYHITGQIHYLSLFLPAKKTLLTIHDLAVLRDRRGIRRWLIRKLLFEYPARRTKFLTVSSESTKHDLIKQTGCPEEKIRIVSLPLPLGMKGTPKQINRSNPTILQIGTAANKNLRRVGSALSGIPCTLRVIGKLSDDEIQFLRDKNINYINRVAISDEEMVCEYRLADIVVFCSLFEGFGLPVIEAQAMCVPVITSDLSPMKDVAGTGALLVDPLQVDKIREAILSIIQEDSLGQQLVSRGTANVRRFLPEKVAEDFLAIYSEILRLQGLDFNRPTKAVAH